MPHPRGCMVTCCARQALVSAWRSCNIVEAWKWPHTMLGGRSMPLTRGSAGFAGQQLCLHHLPARPALHMGRPGRLVVQARTVEPTVGMWGTKQGMDQFFTTEGECYAATIINFAPGNIVTQASPSSAELQGGCPAPQRTEAGRSVRRSRPRNGTATPQCKWGTGSRRRRTSPRTAERSHDDEHTSPSLRQGTAKRLELP